MILDSIQLQNFGVYSGKQRLELSPGSDRPIILIGGLNGGGKTTILDAIQLCLYGARAQISNRGKRLYKEYLAESIHRRANVEDGASIRLSFRRLINGKSHSYEVDRSWSQRGKSVEEALEVWRDGQPDSILSSHWDEYMEQTLPASLAQLFFFDGEQIKDLADHECASRLLKTAIQTLLGLNIVDQLEEDLITLERRKATATKPREVQIKAAELDKDILQLETLAESAAQERAGLVNQTSFAEKQLSELQERFRLEGGELFVRREEVEAQYKALKAQKESNEKQLRELMAGVLPLVLVQSLLLDTQRQAESEVAVKQAITIEKAEKQRDQKILSKLQKELTNDSLAKVKEVLESTRPNRPNNETVTQYIYPTDELLDQMSDLLRAKSIKAKESALALTHNIDTLKEQLTRVETQLAKVPDADSVAKLQKEITSAGALLRDKQAQLALLDDKLRANHNQAEIKSRELAKLLEVETEEGLNAEHDHRILRFSSKVRTTLGSFRDKVIKKHVGRLESLILESFWQLLRKEQLISAFIVDPQTFEITLRDRAGVTMPFDRLSAGERQLLATAILWGLAKASGRPLPTIIDTPLGRLDSSHRRHLVERYFPYASHQVVLLSTDQEIVNGNLKALEPFIQTSYQLAFDEATSTTQVIPGYFNK
jgi:DNA sulfur modification protein DndD